MAGKKKDTETEGSAHGGRGTPYPPEAERNPLDSSAGRTWLDGELAKAEREEKQGPEGMGWAHNESRRPAIVERAEFLRALVSLLK